jgi:hypothetical protein
MLAYTVISEIADPAIAEEFLGWIRPHAAEVVAAGARSAAVVRLDGEAPPVRLEMRYLFASRAAFAAYERDHAPRLRAEGLARFPPERGVRLSRTLGEIVAEV